MSPFYNTIINLETIVRKLTSCYFSLLGTGCLSYMYVHSFKKRNFNSNQLNAKFICVQKYTLIFSGIFLLWYSRLLLKLIF